MLDPNDGGPTSGTSSASGSRRSSSISTSGLIDESFRDKVVVITGSRKGIGSELARALYIKGAKVYCVSRFREHLQALKDQCPGIIIIICNLKNWKDTEEALLESIEEPVDMLVNNAEEIQREDFLAMKGDSITRAIEINVKAVVCVSKVIAKKMIEGGKAGSIVNISSLASIRPSLATGMFAYCASKAAQDMITRCMAVELGKFNIRVNSINPTIVANDFRREFWIGSDCNKEQASILASLTPAGRFAEVSDIINAIIFMLGDKSKMITGTQIMVDGGYSAR